MQKHKVMKVLQLTSDTDPAQEPQHLLGTFVWECCERVEGCFNSADFILLNDDEHVGEQCECEMQVKFKE